MIVSERFNGDKIDFQWAQHDQYGAALRIIIDGCRRHYLEIFKDDSENEVVQTLKNLNSFDHRVLQEFHDDLAAHWRKKYLQQSLSIKDNLNEWLSWLEKETLCLSNKSQVFTSVCFLILDKYNDDQEMQAIKFLKSYAEKAYPLEQEQTSTASALDKISQYLSNLRKSGKYVWSNYDSGPIANIAGGVFLLSCFSLILIATSNQYKLSDFFIVSGLIVLWFIGISVLVITCIFLWCEGEKFIEAGQGKKRLIGYCMKGTVIAIGIALFLLYLPHAYYDPDCPWAGAARYC